MAFFGQNIDFNSLLPTSFTTSSAASPNYSGNRNVAANIWDGNSFQVGGLAGQSSHQAVDTPLPTVNTPTPTPGGSGQVDLSGVSNDIRNILGIEDILSQLSQLSQDRGAGFNPDLSSLNPTAPTTPTPTPTPNPVAPPVSVAPPVVTPPRTTPPPVVTNPPRPTRGGGNVSYENDSMTEQPEFQDNLGGGGSFGNIPTTTDFHPPRTPPRPTPVAQPAPTPVAPPVAAPAPTPAPTPAPVLPSIPSFDIPSLFDTNRPIAPPVIAQPPRTATTPTPTPVVQPPVVPGVPDLSNLDLSGLSLLRGGFGGSLF